MDRLDCIATYVIVFQCNYGPSNQAGNFCGDNFYPHLKKRQFLHLIVDHDLTDIRRSNVGLMKHIWIYVILALTFILVETVKLYHGKEKVADSRPSIFLHQEGYKLLNLQPHHRRQPSGTLQLQSGHY